MDTVQCIFLAAVFLVILWPVVTADRWPISETSGNVQKFSELARLYVFLSSNKYTVVDFYADWCPPCRVISPVFSKLADEYTLKGQLAFVKVNIDHCKDAAKLYWILTVPTFLFFEDGEPRPVFVQKDERSGSMKIPQDGRIDKIQGGNVALLRSVVQVLAVKATTIRES
ncbi:thioredoxin I [Penicillium malachiteum]|nr:thioredoxin I [Penicillium malachiteum]